VDPTTVCCPPLDGLARSQVGHRHIGMHAQQEPRFICTPYRETLSATKGTALYRLRISAEMVTRG
jgi:hypothetical protein